MKTTRFLWCCCVVSLDMLSLTPTVRAATTTTLSATASTITITGALAAPYPSIIHFDDIPGLSTNVVIALNGVTHARPDDIDALLVGPHGERILLMSDAGGTTSITNINLSFSHTATNPLPDSLSITSGVFQPTDYGTAEKMPEPAPDGPYTNTLTDLEGVAPNGSWSLYVRDDSSGATGSIAGGWSVTFTVPQFPPAIIDQPLSQAVALGSTLRLIASASGTPPLRYQWQKDNMNIPMANGSTLTIPNIAAAHAGNYRLIVTNAFGFGRATSAVAVVTIVSPPRIDVQPVSRLSSVGAVNVSFSVTASGTSPFRYQWRQNGWNLPGETNTTLQIANVTRMRGGSYSVAVANDAAVVISQGAALILTNLLFYNPLDNFANMGTLLPSQPNVLVRGTNVGATKQPGEPNHGGKFGGSSVWFTWYSQFGGIATVQTLGSTFDTLLGVYTGNNVAVLTKRADNEDGGPFYTSVVRFNVEPLTLYHIAIDGFDNQQGHFVLSVDLEQPTYRLPEIISAPANQTVTNGGAAVFQIVPAEPDYTYQWYFESASNQRPTRTRRPILDATNSEFQVSPVGILEVGTYFVAVHRGLGGITNAARLEIGPVQGLVSEDKFPDLLRSRGLPVDPPVIPTPHGPIDAAECMDIPLNTTNGFTCTVFLTEGVPISLVFDNGTSHPGSDSNVCVVINERTHQSTPFKVVDDAGSRQITVDTVGSEVPTQLKLYTVVTIDGKPIASEEVAGDCVHRGPFGSSIVTYRATTGTRYCALIDAPAGRIHLNLHYGCARQRVLSIARDNAIPTEEALLSWCCTPGTYRLQETLTALDWRYGPTNMIAAGNVHYLLAPVVPDMRLFRLISAPP